MALTARQQAFVEQYARDFNASAAARRAGYSERTANRIGARLLTNVDIQAALRDQVEGRRKRLHLEVGDIIQMLLREALGQGPDTTASARVRAQELLGKHRGMFREEISVWHRFEKLDPAEIERLERLPDSDLCSEFGIEPNGQRH